MNATEAAMTNILLIEDDADLAGMLSDTLAARGYCVWHAATAADAELVLHQARPDLIIIDLMLPDRHGLLLCADLKDWIGVPVIICSATKRKEDPALGLRLGADDFLAKPFSLDELQARLEAALQRASWTSPAACPATPAVQQIGSLVIYRTECRASLGDHALPLTPTEYRLLCAVAARPRQVVSREALADEVWGEHDDGIVRSLDVHMRRLRAKLQATAVPGPRVATRRGFGYQLVDDAGPS
jgi:two-component system, OmpR family, response regulator MtrA